MLEIIFWITLAIVFYTYFGYAMLLYALLFFKRIFGTEIKLKKPENDQWPEVSLLIAAYNEKDWIVEKVKNCLELDYPKDKLNIIFVTDGSDDGTPLILQKYHDQGINVLHQPQRAGKIAAINRAMKYVKNPVCVFTDANTLLNKESIKEIVKHYQDDKVGALAGEKRIARQKNEKAATAGEGIYWKYESFLKKSDSEFYSVVGAAGELFSVRTELFQEVESDTLLDDFIISLRIAAQGYTVKYEPNAYAEELSSLSVKEELKRKVRISAGGWQAMYRLRALLNPFRFGRLSFLYVSHRVLRWTLAPMSLPVIFIANTFLIDNLFYQLVLFAQIKFYILAFLGYYFENRQLRYKAFFVPYYFVMMNYAVYAGFLLYIKKKQSVIWEKAQRMNQADVDVAREV